MYAAIRDFIVSWLGYKEVVEGVKDLGLKSFELALGRDLKGMGFDVSTEWGRREMTKKLSAEDIRICAFLVSNDFSREDIETEIEWVVNVCKAAQNIGVNVVRIDCPGSRMGVAVEDLAKLTAKCIREIMERTSGLDVSLGMENHGIIGNRREFLEGVLNAVSSERMGLTLDTGNFYWYGYPLEEIYEIIEFFAPYVKHTHVKNLSFTEERRRLRREPGEGYPRTASPLYEGDIDLKRVVETLKRAGYNGDLTIEDESLGNFPQQERLNVARKDVEYLKNLI